VSGGGAALPVIDVAPLVGRAAEEGPARSGAAAGIASSSDGPVARVARELAAACRASGFFYAVHHGVDEGLQARLESLSRAFFARDEATKLELRMERGGRAWRGYFPVGGELTSGRPDRKEGLYFGAELPASHPRVCEGIPLHGANLFPDDLPGFREAVLAYMDEMTRLGHALVAGLALSLGLPARFFAERYTSDPLVLFRIFHYPLADDDGSGDAAAGEDWGVGEHTDYGLLTILKQDDSGGLEVRSGHRWIDAPPLPGAFVCNIGDMLDRMTAGRYRSTPHRVRSPRGRSRLSFPFFFDPSFDAEVHPIELADGWTVPEDRTERWDQSSLRELRGTYGDYLLAKVSRVFPALGRDVL
jgi:isopenicillin N synthase-like dioxygenase